MIVIFSSFYFVRKNLALVLVFFFSCQFIQAQGWLPMGSRSHALGNASVAIEDIWAYHHNPAALSNLKKIEFGVSYENRFLMKELQSQGLVVARRRAELHAQNPGRNHGLQRPPATDPKRRTDGGGLAQHSGDTSP